MAKKEESSKKPVEADSENPYSGVVKLDWKKPITKVAGDK